MAADPLNLQWSALAAQLGLALGGNLPGMPQPRPPWSPISTSPETTPGITSCSATRLRLNTDKMS
jgi:hypothetical protein